MHWKKEKRIAAKDEILQQNSRLSGTHNKTATATAATA
jgi:hypothetical protein